MSSGRVSRYCQVDILRKGFLDGILDAKPHREGKTWCVWKAPSSVLPHRKSGCGDFIMKLTKLTLPGPSLAQAPSKVSILL